jgi:PIN domain nuclease of toxin-antitoxin system
VSGPRHNLLLDIQVVLWWLADAPELGPPARAASAGRGNVVLVSAVTAWEIVAKRVLGRLEIPDDSEEALAEEPFTRLAVTWSHALRVGTLPGNHRDPFDRLL